MLYPLANSLGPLLNSILYGGVSSPGEKLGPIYQILLHIVGLITGTIFKTSRNYGSQ